MKIMGMARRAAALLAAAGIIFSAQGFSSYAGVTGVGAAQPEQGGPGVSSGTAEETISEIGPGTADPQEAGQAEAGGLLYSAGGAGSRRTMACAAADPAHGSRPLRRIL